MSNTGHVRRVIDRRLKMSENSVLMESELEKMCVS